MEKGFVRRLRAPLAGAFLLACLPPNATIAAGRRGEGPAGHSAWWEVRLVVTAKGEYTVRGGQAPVAGEYTCRARWEGRLEPDGDDFLLVHLKTEILDWRLREKTGPAGEERVLETPAASKPSLRMNYVLKDGREVEFVFELGGVSIPLQASRFAVALELPRSSARAPRLPGHTYGDFVCRGSSRIVIPDTDLLEQATERLFSWDWRRERRYVREGRSYVVDQSHAAEVAVALTVH
jgi:hypothetical protein